MGQAVFAREGEPLTSRQVEILRLISKGLTKPQIAERLAWSFDTIKDETRCVRIKLGASNLPHAVAIGYEKRLLP